MELQYVVAAFPSTVLSAKSSFRSHTDEHNFSSHWAARIIHTIHLQAVLYPILSYLLLHFYQNSSNKSYLIRSICLVKTSFHDLCQHSC